MLSYDISWRVSLQFTERPTVMLRILLFFYRIRLISSAPWKTRNVDYQLPDLVKD